MFVFTSAWTTPSQFGFVYKQIRTCDFCDLLSSVSLLPHHFHVRPPPPKYRTVFRILQNRMTTTKGALRHFGRRRDKPSNVARGWQRGRIGLDVLAGFGSPLICPQYADGFTPMDLRPPFCIGFFSLRSTLFGNLSQVAELLQYQLAPRYGSNSPPPPAAPPRPAPRASRWSFRCFIF